MGTLNAHLELLSMIPDRRSICILTVFVVTITLVAERHCIAAPATPTLNPPQVAGNTVLLSWKVPVGATSMRLEAGTSPGASNVVSLVIGAISKSHGS